jgi:hypothetical protein
LANPVYITAPDGTVTVNEGGAVALSARNVLYLDVSYHPTEHLGIANNAPQP